MIDQLILIDKDIFSFINQSLANSFFDAILPLVRNKYTWIPLYVIVAAYLILKHRVKGAIVILFVILAVGLCDYTSSSIVKPIVERIRPCNNPEMSEAIRLLVNCGSGFSFTSSHAANHFGMAVFFIMIFRHVKLLIPVVLFWALTISFAQVYVGIHYPADILGGAILGALLASLAFAGYWKLIPERLKLYS